MTVDTVTSGRRLLPLRGDPFGRPLSRREWTVLMAYAETGDRRQAAARLGIARNTAIGHLTHAYAKLGVLSAIDAFRALGWLRVPQERQAA